MDAVATLADRDDILLLIGSDHGHQTVTGVIDIDEELVTAGLKESLESTDVVRRLERQPPRCSTSIPIFVARTPLVGGLPRQSGMGGKPFSISGRAGVGGAGPGSRSRFCGLNARE